MDAIKIDLNEYVHSGEGANGESLFHKTNPNIMIKLCNPSVSKDIVIQELEHSMKVYQVGIPTPKPGEFITDGNGRFGIRFQRIRDKVSISRAVADNPEQVEALAREFASMCKQLHSTHIKSGIFPDIKDYYLALLNDNPFYTPEEKVKLSAFIKSVPDSDTAIHGDLQFSNVIKAEGKSYFIDLGDFCTGCPDFDLGMVLLCCLYDDAEFLKTTFHLTPELAAEFWQYFVKGYYGEDADPKEIEEHLRPYAGLKCLIMEKYSGCAMLQFHPLLDSILK